MHGERKLWMWDHLTWPELRDRVKDQPVIVLSIGSVEDHGEHLPMDLDNYEVRCLCEAVGEAIPDELLLLPHFPYGFETHHMDYPGTIDIKYDHLIDVETGKVVEFVDPEIEALQKQIAAKLGYRLVDHRMELYGVRLERDEK